jgi:hypothetical protein
MYKRGWEVGESGWRWRRRVFVWEEEMHMLCCAALDLVFLLVTMLRDFVMFIFFVKKIDQVYKWFG